MDVLAIAHTQLIALIVSEQTLKSFIQEIVIEHPTYAGTLLGTRNYQ